MKRIDIRRIKLTPEEKAIEDAADEYVPVSKEQLERTAAALAAYRKDAVLNIRINSGDLAALKRKAKRLGVPYQTWIAEILHQFAA